MISPCKAVEGKVKVRSSIIGVNCEIGLKVGWSLKTGSRSAMMILAIERLESSLPAMAIGVEPVLIMVELAGTNSGNLVVDVARLKESLMRWSRESRVRRMPLS